MGFSGKSCFKANKLAADEVEILVPQRGCQDSHIASHCHFKNTCYDASGWELPKQVVVMKKSAAMKLPEAQLVASGLVDLVPAPKASAAKRATKASPKASAKTPARKRFSKYDDLPASSMTTRS